MTRFGHKLNYVINTFVKHTPGLKDNASYLHGHIEPVRMQRPSQDNP